MIWMWHAICVGLEPQPQPYNITWTHQYPKFPKIHPHQQKHNSVPGDPYAHPQHSKVMVKQFANIWYGCGMQSVLNLSLIHDLTTSLGLISIPSFLKSTLPAPKHNTVRMDPWAHPKLDKRIKQFAYISYGCGMQPLLVWCLSYDLTTSLGLKHIPSFLKSCPTCSSVTV